MKPIFADSENRDLLRSPHTDFGILKSTQPKPERAQRPKPLLSNKVMHKPVLRTTPALESLNRELYNTFLTNDAPYNALQFVPVLQTLNSLGHLEAERLLDNPQSSHVLMQNALLKAVLILWQPGKFSSIHGHPRGGCTFKVLYGKLVEKRYTTDDTQQLLSVSTLQTGSMAYIDDDMGYHAVGNASSTAAISIHVYTPGTK